MAVPTLDHCWPWTLYQSHPNTCFACTWARLHTRVRKRTHREPCSERKEARQCQQWECPPTTQGIIVNSAWGFGIIWLGFGKSPLGPKRPMANASWVWQIFWRAFRIRNLFQITFKPILISNVLLNYPLLNAAFWKKNFSIWNPLHSPKDFS